MGGPDMAQSLKMGGPEMAPHTPPSLGAPGKAVGASRVALTVGAVIVSLRPRQWTKNLFVFAGLVFAQQLFTPAAVVATIAFAIFCGLSGAVYLFNDVADRARDRLHPKKRERPIAAGRLGVATAVSVGSALVVGGLAASLAINAKFA